MEFIKAILVAVPLFAIFAGVLMWMWCLIAITANIALTGKEHEKTEKMIVVTKKAARRLFFIGLISLGVSVGWLYIMPTV